MFNSAVKNQLFATLCANLVTVTVGAAIGWTSPSLILLLSDATPLQSGLISLEEASWICAFFCVGGFIGNIFYGWISNFGRKIPIISIGFIQLIGWLLVFFATNPTYLYMFRFIMGFSASGAYVLIPTFVAEIADNKIRGILGSFLSLSCNIGILISFILGNYVSYELSQFIFIVPPMIFLIGFTFCHETPAILTKQRKDQAAEKSVYFYRNIRRVSLQQLQLLKAEIDNLKIDYQIEANDKSAALTLSDFTNPAARKALLIGIFIMILNQFTGIFPMLNYTASFFAEAGSNLSPNMSAIIIGVIQLAGSYIATILVDKVGRKVLLGFSLTGTGIGFSCLGTYSLLKSLQYDLSSFGWIPLLCFSFSMFCAACGIISLPFVVIAEIMPPKIRSFGSSFCATILWLFGFLSIKYYPIISATFGIHICMFLFAACSLSGVFFIVFVLPETKGKRLNAISQTLNHNANK